jgi:polyphosphate kinase 2 (PPK2 family)
MIYKLWYFSQMKLFDNVPPEDMEEINKWAHHAKIRKHTIIETARDGSGWTLLYKGRRLTSLYCQ